MLNNLAWATDEIGVGVIAKPIVNEPERSNYVMRTFVGGTTRLGRNQHAAAMDAVKYRRRLQSTNARWAT